MKFIGWEVKSYTQGRKTITISRLYILFIPIIYKYNMEINYKTLTKGRIGGVKINNEITFKE